MNTALSKFVEIAGLICYNDPKEVIAMKLVYNISYPAAHTLALFTLVGMGFARMLAWLRWFWVNDLLYLLVAAAVLSGHWLAVQYGRRQQLTNARVMRGVALSGYLLHALQLVLVCVWLIWDMAAPLLSKVKTFSPRVLLALLPVAAVNVCAMVLQLRIDQGCDRLFGQTDEKS